MSDDNSDDNYGFGTLLEDEYYASQGVRTGSAYSEFLVSQQDSNNISKQYTENQPSVFKLVISWS